MIEPGKYKVRSYAEFRRRATDPSLSLNEKCGFAEELRAGYAERILADIRAKLPQLAQTNVRFCDIGAGCGGLGQLIVAATEAGNQRLTVIDSPEMLGLLPSRPHLTKLAGRFPDCAAAGPGALGPFDAVLAYSVVQYVHAEGDLFPFVDAAAGLLAEQGRLLIGDIPNASMRSRFMASAAGKAYHRLHYPHLPEPDLDPEPGDGEIDDRVVLALAERMRAAGFHAFVLPQAPNLPMATRREDLLIVKP